MLLVDYFMDRRNGFEKVITTDCSPYAPALYHSSNHYIVPPMNAPGYIQTIIDICSKEEINAVLPLQEEELLLISKNIGLFKKKGIIPIISDYNTVERCKDKYQFSRYLSDLGISTVPTYSQEEIIEKEEIIFPLYVKPRFGAGSIANSIIADKDSFIKLIKEKQIEFIGQPILKGQEYGVNAYLDIHSNKLIDYFILKKLAMRAGETFKSVSIHNAEINALLNKLCKAISFRGPIDLDIIEENGVYYILEINPRFGGGYPHTYNCGINFPKYIANNISGELLQRFTSYKDDVVALRYTDIIIV